MVHAFGSAWRNRVTERWGDRFDEFKIKTYAWIDRDSVELKSRLATTPVFTGAFSCRQARSVEPLCLDWDHGSVSRLVFLSDSEVSVGLCNGTMRPKNGLYCDACSAVFRFWSWLHHRQKVRPHTSFGLRHARVRGVEQQGE